MNAIEESNAGWLVTRLVLRAGLALSAVGAVFLAYLAMILPAGREALLPALAKVGAAQLCFGGALLTGTYVYLSPARLALVELASGRPLAAALAEAAHQRIVRLPLLGAFATMVAWLAGALIIEPSLGALALGPAAVNAGLLAALCTGVVSALLFYYLVVREALILRQQLPAGPGAAVWGAPIGSRMLVTSIATLMVGVTFVGVSAYLHYQTALERAAVTSCERALRALATVEGSSQAITAAAASACDGSASLVAGGRVLASLGVEQLPTLPARGPKGVLLHLPLRSGAELYALVGDRARRAEVAAFRNEMVTFAGIALLLAVGVALVASRAITAPVKGLAEGAEAIARGDLSREVQVLTDDEIGSLASSLAAMTQGLRQLVRRVTGAAENVKAQVKILEKAGGQVQSGLQARRAGVAGATIEMKAMDQSVAGVGRDVAGLSEYVQTTSAALAEFAASLDEVPRHGAEVEKAVGEARGEVLALMKAAEGTRSEIAALAQAANHTLTTIGESSRTLRALNEAAAESERVAQRLFEETETGLSVVEEGVRGVEAIRGVVGEAKHRVEALGNRSADITAVVDFIAEVAGRTNLLSLNAAIIAAQAGEQGKPFGVVADQIRELAAQIGSSTKRIGDIIAGVRVEVEATSALIEQSDELAAVGVERAREGGLALRRIAGETKRARAVSAAIGPAVAAHSDTSSQIEQLAARVVEMAQGFAGAELLVRGGRSIEALSQTLTPLTQRVGRALEEQAGVSRRQVQSLEELNRMMGRLNRTVLQHGEGTTRVLRSLSQLVALADEDRMASDELAAAAEALSRHFAVLSEGLDQFRT